VQVGQHVVVKNSDPFFHNVHTMPQANPEENIPELNIDPGKKLKAWDQPEYFPVGCNIHPWMRAWVAVIDNKFFAITDKDGKYTLPKDLPDGKYTLHAWHEKYGEQDQKITVKDGKATGDFVYKAE
jgi:hypothetical protein